MQTEKIRNFCIIAHIDHGKSTLADRMLEATGTLSHVQHDQVLDNMDLERERGITIKAHSVTMKYKHTDKKEYTLNLIDTPGHVDFTYEVSRSLAACEGAILVVDASQGVEAQTISNLFLAMENDLAIIPVLNKVDLQSAEIEAVSKQIVDILGIDKEEIILASAKAGIGIDQILAATVERIPAPRNEPSKPLRALIFDSLFDSYRGAIAYVRIFEGQLSAGDQIKFFSTGKNFEVAEVGIMQLRQIKKPTLNTGEVGYCIAGAKQVADTKVGDTIISASNPASEPLPGYQEVKPMVFSGLFPSDNEDYEELRSSLERLKLNDASLVYEPETSQALGFGFRCGFLGLLHMEIIQERLDREYNLDILTTVPNVEYRAHTKASELILVDNPSMMPGIAELDYVEEPYISADIIVPSEYIGNIMKLSQDRRGIYKNTEYIDPTRASLHYDFPLAEIIFDFYDKLKSFTRGYASLDYQFCDYRKSDLVKLDIMLNGEPVDALSYIIHKDKSYEWGRKICSKLKELIPRQMFEVAVQAAIGNKVISRSSVKALRKNVTAKCYGGDISRKRKLLEKQKEGKKRMKQVGKVELPQEAFLAVLQVE